MCREEQFPWNNFNFFTDRIGPRLLAFVEHVCIEYIKKTEARQNQHQHLSALGEGNLKAIAPRTAPASSPQSAAAAPAVATGAGAPKEWATEGDAAVAAEEEGRMPVLVNILVSSGVRLRSDSPLPTPPPPPPLNPLGVPPTAAAAAALVRAQA